MSQEMLQTSLRYDGPLTILQLHGELDFTTTPGFSAALQQIRQQAPPLHLVLDLSQVSFCDSSGIGAMIAAAKSVREAENGLLVLVGAHGMCERLLKHTGLHRLLPMYPTLADVPPQG